MGNTSSVYAVSIRPMSSESRPSRRINLLQNPNPAQARKELHYDVQPEPIERPCSEIRPDAESPEISFTVYTVGHGVSRRALCHIPAAFIVGIVYNVFCAEIAE